MKKIIHIEDNPCWQEAVRSALAPNPNIGPVLAFGCVEDLRRANYPYADLYVCDRHLPDKPGQRPNDSSWKQIVDTLYCLYSDLKVPMIILSSLPPADWRKHRGIVEAIQKPWSPQIFNAEEFRAKIEFYLGVGGAK